MNSYERLLAAVTFEEYDRPPFSDNEWNELLPDLVPGLTGCAPRGKRSYSEAARIAAVKASMDMVPWSHLYDHPRYPILGRTPASQEGRRWTDEDGFGWLAQGFSEWVVRRPFSDLHGFLEYLERKATYFRRLSTSLPTDFEQKLQAARRKLKDVCIALPYLGAGLDNLYRLGGWEIFAQAVIEQPQAIADYLEANAEHTAGLVHSYARHITARHCPVALGAYSDIACNTGLLLSPRFLHSALKPAVRKIVEAYHEHGIKVIYHSEGDMRAFLSDLIEAGVDGINPLSSSEQMDPVIIRRLYPRLILWGGINERTVLVTGSPEDTRQEVRRVVDGVGMGLILGSSGGVHPACKIENCIVMVQELRRQI
jgi:hypothetical protein